MDEVKSDNLTTHPRVSLAAVVGNHRRVPARALTDSATTKSASVKNSLTGDSQIASKLDLCLNCRPESQNDTSETPSQENLSAGTSLIFSFIYESKHLWRRKKNLYTKPFYSLQTAHQMEKKLTLSKWPKRRISQKTTGTIYRYADDYNLPIRRNTLASFAPHLP